MPIDADAGDVWRVGPSGGHPEFYLSAPLDHPSAASVRVDPQVLALEGSWRGVILAEAPVEGVVWEELSTQPKPKDAIFFSGRTTLWQRRSSSPRRSLSASSAAVLVGAVSGGEQLTGVAAMSPIAVSTDM